MIENIDVVEKPKTELIVPVAFAQEIINYLQTRPYSEVFQIIGKLIEMAKSQGIK
jgi:hypothetical protein